MTVSFSGRAFLSLATAFVLVLGLAGTAGARDLDERRLVRRAHPDGFLGSARSGMPHDRFDRGPRGDSRFEPGRGWRAHERVPEYRGERFLPERRGARDRVHAGRRGAGRHEARGDAWSNRVAVRGDRDRAPRYDGAFGGSPVRPSIIVGSGTFSGNVSHWYERGNGSYFTIERHGFRSDRRLAGAEGRLARSRIVDAGPGSGHGACSYEAGVCVIRGP